MKRYFLASFFLNAFFITDLLTADQQVASDLCDNGPRPNRITVRHIEANGIGYNSGYSTLEAFLSPTEYYSDCWFPFLDFRAHLLNDATPAVNAGVGLRALAYDRVWGVNSYYDYRKSNDAHYNQIGIGFETLGEIWDIRVNGYIPLGHHKTHIHDVTYLGIVGHHPTYYAKRQFSLSGFDIELGAHVDVLENFPIYFAANTYYLTGHGKSTWGGQLRGSIDILDYLRFEANTSYDGIYNWIGQGQISLIAPLGERKTVKKEKDQDCKSSKLIAQRAVQRVFRQEIIPVKSQQENQLAINPDTGLPYYFIFVGPNGNSDGTINDPYGDLHEAIANSHPFDFFYISGDDLSGEQATYNAGSEPYMFLDGQHVLGSVNSVFGPLNFVSQYGEFSAPYVTENRPIISANVNTTVVVTAGEDMVFFGLEVLGDGDSDVPLVEIPETSGMISFEYFRVSSESEYRNLVSASDYSGSIQFSTSEFIYGNSVFDLSYNLPNADLNLQVYDSIVSDLETSKRMVSLNQTAGRVVFDHNSISSFDLGENYAFIRSTGGDLQLYTANLELDVPVFTDLEATGYANITIFHGDLDITSEQFDDLLVQNLSEVRITYQGGSMFGNLGFAEVDDNSFLSLGYEGLTQNLITGFSVEVADVGEANFSFTEDVIVLQDSFFLDIAASDSSSVSFDVSASNVVSTFSGNLTLHPDLNILSFSDDATGSLSFENSMVSSVQNTFGIITNNDSYLGFYLYENTINMFGEGAIFEIARNNNSVLDIESNEGHLTAQTGFIAEMIVTGEGTDPYVGPYGVYLQHHGDTISSNVGHRVVAHDESIVQLELNDVVINTFENLAVLSNDQDYANSASINYAYKNLDANVYNGFYIDSNWDGSISVLPLDYNLSSSIYSRGEYVTKIEAQLSGHAFVTLEKMFVTSQPPFAEYPTYAMHNITAAELAIVEFTSDVSDHVISVEYLAENLGIMLINSTEDAQVTVGFHGLSEEYRSVIESPAKVFDVTVFGNSGNTTNISTSKMDVTSGSDFVNLDMGSDVDYITTPEITFQHSDDLLHVTGIVHNILISDHGDGDYAQINMTMTDTVVSGNAPNDADCTLAQFSKSEGNDGKITCDFEYNGVTASFQNGIYFIMNSDDALVLDVIDSSFTANGNYNSTFDFDVASTLDVNFTNSDFVSNQAVDPEYPYMNFFLSYEGAEINFTSEDCSYSTQSEYIQKSIFGFFLGANGSIVADVYNTEYPEYSSKTVVSSKDVFHLEDQNQVLVGNLTLSTENLEIEYVANHYVSVESKGDVGAIFNITNDHDEIYGDADLMGDYYLHYVDVVGYPNVTITATDCLANSINLAYLSNATAEYTTGNYEFSYDGFVGTDMPIGLDATLRNSSNLNFEFNNSSWTGAEREDVIFVKLIGENDSKTTISIDNSIVESSYVYPYYPSLQDANINQDAELKYDVSNSSMTSDNTSSIFNLEMIGGVSKADIEFINNNLTSTGGKIFNVVFENNSDLFAAVLNNTLHADSGDIWEQVTPTALSKGCVVYVGNNGDTETNVFAKLTNTGEFTVNYDLNSRPATISVNITEGTCSED